MPNDVTTITISESTSLKRFAPVNIIIPVTGAMTPALPGGGTSLQSHNPFSSAIPTIQGFDDKVLLINSLQRPRKITVLGSDGQRYLFLCKPKDDLRKDARMMEVNSIVNKLLLKDPEARRRRLRIRTYSVVPLNEECGFLEWVRLVLLVEYG